MKKHTGAALLAVVLITFILLAILSSVAFSIAAQTKKTEVWQMTHKQNQMAFLARSAVIAVSEAVTANGSMAETSGDSTSIELKDGSDKIADLTLVISSDTPSTAQIYATAEADGKKITIIGKYSKITHTITGWDRRDE